MGFDDSPYTYGSGLRAGHGFGWPPGRVQCEFPFIPHPFGITVLSQSTGTTADLPALAGGLIAVS